MCDTRNRLGVVSSPVVGQEVRACGLETVLLEEGLLPHAVALSDRLKDGVALAARSIDSGTAAAKLEGLIALSQRLATE